MKRNNRHCHDGTAITLAILSASLLVGCRGGERQRPAGDTTSPAGPAAGAESAPTPGAAATPTSMTPAMIATGDSIFHGTLAGGTCITCHGPDAKGTPTAPNLTDQQWLDSDGSYESIVNTVTNGVPQPKQHPAPMPPMGGASLSPEQVRAVAAYVYSLSHPSR